MKCGCGGDLRVTETREFNNVVYRRRVCLTCNKRSFTAENFVPAEVGKKGINHYQSLRGGKNG